MYLNQEYEILSQIKNNSQYLRNIKTQHAVIKKAVEAQLSLYKMADSLSGGFAAAIEGVFQTLKEMNAPAYAFENARKLYGDNSLFHYLKWISKETDYNFYLVDAGNGPVSLMDQNLEVFIRIHLCNPHKIVASFTGDQQVIEIENIYSFKKGAGYEMMTKIIAFARQQKLPITLWTATEENVEYFERYGFKNYGKLGRNQESLMIKKPSL
jgi:hypothetical protein